jgi:glycosyltransferase involved in cell wall biosynthesis
VARCIWNQRLVLDHYISLRCQRVAARRASCLIANAQHAAQSLIDQFGVDPQRVHVVRNGIDLGRLGSPGGTDWRERLGIAAGAFVACKLARMSFQKDHATVLRAWRKVVDVLAADGPAPVLLLAGRSVDSVDAAKALAYDLELGRQVRFLGHVEDVVGLLKTADLGVFATWAEGCPNGVLECMAAGLAVAATDNPGVREAMGPGNERYIVPQSDAEALAELVVDLARRSDERHRVGLANKKWVTEQFSYTGMCEATVRLMAAPEWQRSGPCAE